MPEGAAVTFPQTVAESASAAGQAGHKPNWGHLDWEREKVASVFDQPGEWFVLHTRSRQEKVLSLQMTAMGIAHFLPLRRQVRYHGRRKCSVDSPLFSNYLFLRGSLGDAYLVDRTKRIANIIRCPDQRKIEWELRNIHLALLRDAPLSQHHSLVKGKRVEIRVGPFRGLQGVVEDHRKCDRLILQVEALGRAVSLEIDGSLLDLIE